MKFLNLKSFIPVLITTGIVACSGGGNQVAGIGGSGYVSTGTVTGFGSVFVNGVKFETDTSSFEVEDNITALQSDLRVGMVVQVFGSINSDGITGTATNIHYSDDLQGPINTITTNPDNTKTLDILGKTVIVDSADTIFDGGVTYIDLMEGDVLEVSGYYDNANQLHATYVAFKSPLSKVEISGPISSISPDTIFIHGVEINTSAVDLSDLTNGLQIGLVVEVEGTYASGTLTATEIEENEFELTDDGSEVSLEGFITDYLNDGDFKINGQQINASNADLVPTSLILENGIKVEVEGTVTNGILNASEVESRSGGAEVSATISDISNIAVNSSFTVEVLSGQFITVQFTTATRGEDDLGEGQLDFSTLSDGDFVEVGGFESDANTITATRIKRIVGEKTELQGVITTHDLSSVTVLDIVFPVDLETSYSDELEASIADFSAFKAAITLGVSVINIEDDLLPEVNPVGIADSVEIEEP